MPLGITRYIASLAPPPQMRGVGRRAHAVQHGIQVDHCVRRTFNGEKRKVRHDVQTAANRFFQELQHADVLLVGTQHRVVNSAKTIATHLDGLGRSRDHRDIAVELKTSLYPLAVYQQHYQTTVGSHRRELLPGVPNTWYWRHQLQAGFGVHCLGDRAKGLVVVVCPDGAMHHWVQSAATAAANFSRPVVNQPPRVRLLKWPGHPSVKDVVKGLGRPHKKVVAGIARYTNGLVGAVSATGTKRAEKQRALLREAGRRGAVRAYMLCSTAGTLSLIPA